MRENMNTQRTSRHSKSPLVSIVTPSYNQGRFIRATIESVLSQDYPNLEYWVVDGGSSDETLAILRQYESDPRFHWLSEPDGGQADAINKGFRSTSGEILGWINSDDLYCPGALRYCGEYFLAHPEIDVLYGNVYLIREDGSKIRELRHAKFDPEFLFHVGIDLHQQGMFWRREPFLQIGLLDPSLKFSMDFDLFVKFTLMGVRFERTGRFLGSFRLHGKAKTALIPAVGSAEHQQILRRILSAPQGEQRARARRWYLHSKRALWFLGNGEWGYVAKGIRRRLGCSPKSQ